MSLVDLPPSKGGPVLPGDVRAFLREAEQRIEQFQAAGHVPGFVPSDFERVYSVLHDLAAEELTPGKLFCEWGSGFGVVACLAAMLEFDACGIEIDGTLVAEARQLADDFDLPVQFDRGSFIPNDAEPGDAYGWLSIDDSDTHDELGLAPDDFDVIFAYPWPDEERLTEDLFERYARPGAVLVTYHGGDEFQLRRKKGRGSRRR